MWMCNLYKMISRVLDDWEDQKEDDAQIKEEAAKFVIPAK